ncbi:MAG: RHS repeat protein [Planctomycetota bacterium]|nr:MAG: RHS repeat protein [Planctomycetota bacterium]
MGNGWDHSYNIFLKAHGGKLVVNNGYGRRDLYHPEPNGIWAADGFFRELAQEADGSFTLTFFDKGTWAFLAADDPNAPLKISAITDRNGNSLTFDYDSLGRLTTVHDTLDTAENSRDITIAYNANGLIESVTDWTGRQVTYEYYGTGEPNGCAGDLKSATLPEVRGTPTGNDFPAGKTTTYTYTKGFSDERLNHNLLTITDPNGQTYLQNTYGTDADDPNFDHVVRQILGEANDIIDFTYMQEVPEANNNYAVTRSVANDCVGNITERLYDNENRLVIFRQYTGRADPNLPTSIDPNVNMPTDPLRPDDPPFFETRFQYNKDFLPTRIDYPNGNYVTYVYEGDLNPDASVRSRGNLRERHRFAGSLEAVSDQNEITVLFEYDPNVNNGTNRVTRYVSHRGFETLYDYDPNGNCVHAEHVRPTDSNIIQQWQYNEHGQLTASILPDNGSGRKRRDGYTYYADPCDPNYGYLKDAIVDVNNLALTTTFEYDGVGNLRRITDPRGHDTQFIVNQLDQVVRITSREVTDGNNVRYQRDIYYDEKDNIVQIDVQNKDEAGILQANTHFTTTFEYDILNRLTRTSAEVNSVHLIVNEFEYDDNGSLSLIRFGEATNGNQPKNVIRCLYDERGLLFQTVRAETDPNQSSTQFDYDGNGNLKKVSQGLEATPRVSSFVHDGFGRLVEVSSLMGNVFEYDYDPAGNVAANRIEGELVDDPTDSNNVRLYESSFEYDSLNRLIHAEVLHFDPNTQSPIGDGNSVAQIFYSDNSQVTKVIDDRGNETRCEYDTANRRSVVTDAKGNKVTLTYDENSNITALTEVEKSDLGDPNEVFVTALKYDNLDRLTKVTDNNDNSTWFAYDSRGNCTQITDALNNETRCEYDGLSRLTQTVRDMDGDGADAGDANDIVTSQSWDDSSRLVSQADDNGNTTTYEYDALNRGNKIIYADGTDKQVVYDVHDNVTHGTDGAGSAVNCTYDLLGRLTAKAITPGLGVSDDTTFENYEYDGLSRLVFAQDDDSNLTFSYDSLSNVTTETLNGKSTTSVYDGMGNRLSCTYPSGRVITCTFDELNRKKTISDVNGLIASYDYIGPGRVERRSFSNNTVCDYSYDDVKRITATTHVFDPCGADTIIDSRTYTWDEMYNKTQRKDIRASGAELTHDYTYDSANRLVQTTVTDSNSAVVRNTVYTLDGVGNRTEVTGSPDAGTYTMDPNTPEPADANMNQYTTTPFDSRQYDKNGNLITIDNATQKDIIYDYRNQMVEVNDVNTGQVHTYAYDALGRRIEKVVDSDGSPQITRFFYDEWQVIKEQDGDGNTLATYVYGNYIDEVVNMQRDSNDYYYHTDDLFDVMAVTDACGLVVERYEYQDYGEPNLFDGSGAPISSTAIGNSYLFTGRRYDPETGWYNYGSRYLDPRAGRFICRDAIGIWDYAGNLGNGCSYFGNNPASQTDRTGNGMGSRIFRSNSNMSYNLQYLQLQNKMQRDNRQFTLISNIMKMKHDTAKNLINNIR